MRFRIVSRMLAAAFDNGSDEQQTAHFIECAECHGRDPHSVMSAADDLSETAEWQHKHIQETGHREFYRYELTRIKAKVIQSFRPSE